MGENQLDAPVGKVPVVSVIMSVYNGEKYVKRALDSILNQSFSDFEFIILNDGSTDGTRKILDEVIDPRVRIVHKKNEGLGKSLNLGIQMARGEFIARLDADDVARCDRLDKQVAYLRSHTDVAVLGSACRVIYSDGSEQIRLRPLEPENTLKHIIKICPVAHSSVTMRREAVMRLGGYDVNFDGSLGRSAGMDYHLWVRFMAQGMKIANLPDPLITYYKLAASITGKKSLKFRLIERVKLRLWARKALRLRYKSYMEILVVSIFTILSWLGLRLDDSFNFLTSGKNDAGGKNRWVLQSSQRQQA